MPDITIQIESLGKRYRYGEVKANISLRDDITQWVRGVLGKNGKGPQFSLRAVQQRRMDESTDYFWALKDINLDIHHGDVVGIIGRNGAGKSTLLKILSRITAPTTGRVTYHGRIASLLEVGTGFHRDLTGRENVFLNGSILGMKRSEIARKFDEIVAFAEVEKFIDTPVKFYSSGMYVRLAFAVAAHLEPEILVIDEVLAVGDSSFQKKCLGKMNDVARQGRTVLFVSHNTAAVLSLCARAVWLHHGRMMQQGVTREVVQAYMQAASKSETTPLDQRLDRSGDGSIRITSLRIESEDPDRLIRSASRLRFIIGYRSQDPVRRAEFRIAVYDYTSGAGLFVLDNDAVDCLPESLPSEGLVTCVTDPIHLTPGRCFVDISIGKGRGLADSISHARTFDVEPDDTFNSGKIPSRDGALCLIKQRWSF